MDIQIVRDGKQTGPYTEEAVHALLKEGSVLVSDLAWRPGLPDWVPLVNLLYPAATRPPAPPVPAPEPAAEPREPATARQIAFLTYVGVAYATDISKEEASLLVNDAMENPRDPARLARWNEERLRRHPELFAAEIQARKENRPQHFLEICQREGAAFFDKVTKAHCQVLVSHLDVHAPNWDAREREAATKYFFPALAEKFPQLLTEAGRAKYTTTPKSPAVSRQPKSSPIVAKPRPTSGRGVGKVLYAMGRGVFLGLIILGLLWVGRGFFVPKPVPMKKSVPTADGPTVAPAAEAAPAAPAAPTPPTIAETKARPAESPAKPAEVPPPAPTAASPEPAMNAAEPMSPAANPAPSLFGEMPAAPAAAPAPAPASAARTSVVLTKPVEITSSFGKISVPVGTAVRIVAQNGAALTVRYLDHEVTIPASSTDLDADSPATAATRQ